MYKLSHPVFPFFRDLDPVTIANDHCFLEHLPHHTFHQSPLAVRISGVGKSIIVVAMPKCPVVPHRVSLEAAGFYEADFGYDSTNQVQTQKTKHTSHTVAYHRVLAKMMIVVVTNTISYTWKVQITAFDPLHCR